MRLISTRIRRFAVVGAFAVTAAAAPAVLAATAPQNAPGISAAPPCLAWVGNKEDGNCLSYSNGAPTQIGTPSWGYGPSGGGIYSGPLLPGTTINQGIG